MKFSLATLLVVGLATEATVASTWFSKPIYNKWHETELERWLSDHDVPFPTAADRKDLENLVKDNWNSAVESPYTNWDTDRLQKYLASQGKEAQKGAKQNKDSLVASVKQSWFDTEGTASSAYGNVKDWVFDSWTESSLKAFADKNGIPVPQPRARDSLLKSVRDNYQSAANKAGETVAYPGNWLYSAWSDSDFKSWLDEHGIPAPQPSTRDKLVASVRRNSYVAAKQANAFIASASKSAAAAQKTLSDAVFDAWSDSEIKAWADKNGIKVPQGSNRNELLAIARKNIAKLTGDNIYASGSSVYNAASKSAGSLAGQASKSAGSLAGEASKSAGYLAGEASKSGGSLAGEASKSAGSLAGEASKSAASLAGVGAKSASSAGSVASKSGKVAASAASKSGKSVASDASKAAAASASSASKSAVSAGKVYSGSAASAYGAATSSAGNEYAKATDDAALKGNQLYYQASSYIMNVVNEVQIAVGLKTNYLSSASKSAYSVSSRASASVQSVRNEL